MRRLRSLIAGVLPLGARPMLDRIEIHEFAYRSQRVLEALCRARVQPAYIGENQALCRILGRYKLFVDTRDQGLCAHLLLDGFWEMPLTMFMARHLRSGMVAIDVGANFGYFTTLLAALVGQSGRVYSIEPAPDTAAMLHRSIALNLFQLRTTIIEAAAGAGDGTSLFYVPHREPKNARLVPSPEGIDAAAGTLHEIPVRRIDDVVAQEHRVDFVKVDAEGAEEAVIAGMEMILRRDQPCLVLEFNAGRVRDPNALLATLSTLYGGLHYLDARGKLWETTAAEVAGRRITFEGKEFAIDWSLVCGAGRPGNTTRAA
jgi:FkbM family methyltransferase